MVTLPVTRVYVEKISYICVEVRAVETLSSNHRRSSPVQARVGEQLHTVEYLVQSRVVKLSQRKVERDRS